MCNYAYLKGKKQMEILCKVWRWARDQGKYDIHDRRYYLTPVDVKNICQRYKSNKRFVITFIHFDFLQWLTIRPYYSYFGGDRYKCLFTYASLKTPHLKSLF